MPKTNITSYITNSYSNILDLTAMKKRTQSKPTCLAEALAKADLPPMADKIALPVRHSFSDGGSVVEGPVKY
jgi:hypothetical protein